MRANAIDEKPYIEYVCGRPTPKVSPKRRHGLLQFEMARRIADSGSRFGVTATEWRFCLDDTPGKTTSLVPDVAFVTRERLAPLTPEEREEPSFAPDIAVEVRSPSDRPAFIRAKAEAYLHFGGSIVFDVDPESRTIRTFTASGVADYREGATITDERFPWLSIDVRGVFAALDVD